MAADTVCTVCCTLRRLRLGDLMSVALEPRGEYDRAGHAARSGPHGDRSPTSTASSKVAVWRRRSSSAAARKRCMAGVPNLQARALGDDARVIKSVLGAAKNHSLESCQECFIRTTLVLVKQNKAAGWTSGPALGVLACASLGAFVH